MSMPRPETSNRSANRQGGSCMSEAVTMPTFTTDELTAASDADLDHALARLYRLHYEATDRAETHAAIMAVLDEQARRRDEWLKERA